MSRPYALVAAGLALTAGCGSGPAVQQQAAAPLLPVTAAGPPAPPGRLDPVPAPGTVVHGSGPFDDRYGLTVVRLRDRTLTGTLVVTADVSELLDLEVHVACYDRAGGLLGVARQVVHGEDHAHGAADRGAADAHGADEHRGDEPDADGVPLRLRCPAGVRSAVLTVPVLVNE